MIYLPLIDILAISIHAPSRERLSNCKISHRYRLYFNPRSLAGATSYGPFLIGGVTLFQSTLPRGSDANSVAQTNALVISIHAPSRERHDEHIRWSPVTGISIHAPSRERPLMPGCNVRSSLISIHAPSRERHADNVALYKQNLNFNPRSLAGAT